MGAVPDKYLNLYDKDPWDNDAIEWLMSQPGGSDWIYHNLHSALTHQRSFVRSRPELVARAEEFATRHGVRWVEEPYFSTTIVRLYRSDPDAPDYPADPSDRAALRREWKARAGGQSRTLAQYDRMWKPYVDDRFRRWGVWTYPDRLVRLDFHVASDLGARMDRDRTIDLVAYQPIEDLILIVSRRMCPAPSGLSMDAFDGSSPSYGRLYRMLNDHRYREAMTEALFEGLIRERLVPPTARIEYWAVTDGFAPGQEALVRAHFERNNWVLLGPRWLSRHHPPPWLRSPLPRT